MGECAPRFGIGRLIFSACPKLCGRVKKSCGRYVIGSWVLDNAERVIAHPLALSSETSNPTRNIDFLDGRYFPTVAELTIVRPSPSPLDEQKTCTWSMPAE